MSGQVTGIGGVFIRARDVDTLRQWYAEHLGLPIQGDAGAQFTATAPATSVFSVFPADTGYFGRPDQAAMVNFRVDDLDAVLERLRSAGAEVADETMDGEYGKFGWVVDPEGNRVELWEPPAGG